MPWQQLNQFVKQHKFPHLPSYYELAKNNLRLHKKYMYIVQYIGELFCEIKTFCRYEQQRKKYTVIFLI